MSEQLILLRNLKVPVGVTEEEICAIASRKAAKAGGKVLRSGLNKRSVDARKRDHLQFVCSVALTLANRLSPEKLAALDACEIEQANLKLTFGEEKLSDRPLVVGFGPCGMFAAVILAENGYRPIVIERGGDISERAEKVALFHEKQILDESCNVQFGAGGAGTFSDGKCVTRVNDPLCRYVLERLVGFGAPESLLTLAKPHIGTDRLRELVARVEDYIVAHGGEVRYHTKLTGVKTVGGKVTAAATDAGEIPCGALVLAIGHSARDTYEMLGKSGFALQPKDFSVGVRIEHLQEEIDAAMYGRNADIASLGHAEYTLSKREGDRGVYTFCMCPGGLVMAAASEAGGVVVNGMSYFARDGKNANSAVAVSVLRSDYGDTPEKAIAFQRKIERAAFAAGGSNYYAPIQTVGDFLTGGKGTLPTKVRPTYMNGDGVTPADLHTVLPPFVTSMLERGIAAFDRQIAGFAAPYAVLTGAETRTSSPIRILREETLHTGNLDNLYPGGEGAGYAGGITSAALDGVRIAAAILKRYRPLEG